MEISCNLKKNLAAVNAMLSEKNDEISKSKEEIRILKSKLTELEKNEIFENEELEIDSLVDEVFQKEEGEISDSDTEESIAISSMDCIIFNFPLNTESKIYF